ncbi:hypothetical protein N8J89_16555 [Crossiella sp. CA-258035]|uniref:glycine-rich domain-containing protein n=1 Tax=Crossiella sp. CA-258035 TaxID=2981138 RepID=UPI0024BCF22A|nr:hypothetical protein [Crossiella sp. CA-258035]WHT22610.1 hypothetical protein N8J89_16555 [Crossiella sp. CA-258035]
MPITPTAVRDARDYLPAAQWDRLVTLIRRDHHLDRALSERILGQTIAFLITCCRNPGLSLRPSPMVDLGWHTFLHDTPAYWEFSQLHNGEYIHHIPDLTENDPESPLALRATIQAMRDSGFIVDEELWAGQAADCNQCYAGCSNSPRKAA